MSDRRERLVQGLSSERIDPYLKACDGDLTAALRLYAINIELSAAFTGPLHVFEVILRNALYTALVSHFSRADWWNHHRIQLHRVAHLMLEEANRTLHGKNKFVTPGRIVAELSLGFWVSLLGKGNNYETRLWRPALRLAFPNYQGHMKGLNEELNTIRLLRNRISHLEPIHHRDLAADHRKIIRVVGYISHEAVEFIRQHERVSHALDRQPAVRRGEALPSF
jgi:hypothetical protein